MNQALQLKDIILKEIQKKNLTEDIKEIRLQKLKNPITFTIMSQILIILQAEDLDSLDDL